MRGILSNATYCGYVTGKRDATLSTTGGSNAARRYMCSARRYGNPCGEPIVLAERLEQQLVGWIRDVKPDQRLIDRIVKGSRSRAPLLALFEQVWAQEGRIVAVQPHEDFVPYFQAANRCRAGRGNGRGDKSGSDGTRTRDLCRDRAAL